MSEKKAVVGVICGGDGIRVAAPARRR